MDEKERYELTKANKMMQLEKNFGLHNYCKYKLKDFEILPGNELAYKTALQFLMIPPDLNIPDDDDGADRYDEWLETQPVLHHFLTLVGDCGRGKTRIAIGIGILSMRLFEQRTIYYQVPDLLSEMRATFNRDNYDDGPTLDDILRKCKSADLLILDDLGMQKNTDWAVEQLDSIIDYRYAHSLLTIFTTNLTPNRLPKRIASRIKEGEVVTLTGGDYREIIAKRRLEARSVIAEAETIIDGKKR